jgi:hypothetical protein
VKPLYSKADLLNSVSQSMRLNEDETKDQQEKLLG